MAASGQDFVIDDSKTDKVLVLGCGRNTDPYDDGGCGHSHKKRAEGWVTVDIEEGMKPDIEGDLTKTSFAEEILGECGTFNTVLTESIDGVVFYQENLDRSCSNINALLAPGGYFLLRCGGAMFYNDVFVGVDSGTIRNSVKTKLVETFKFVHLGEHDFQCSSDGDLEFEWFRKPKS